MASWREGAQERLVSAITAELDGAVMVESFVLVASVMDSDEGGSLVVEFAPNQLLHTTLGLIESVRIDMHEFARRTEWES